MQRFDVIVIGVHLDIRLIVMLKIQKEESKHSREQQYIFLALSVRKWL
jgi:hypothetical protein